ncbi:MAG: helix-turn-helix domain-containing protein [Acidobacteriota bacterium]
MSRQTESSRFIVSPFSELAEFYQQLLSGITSYEGLGTRVIGLIKTAYAFRQAKQVRELSNILINIPLREYQLIGRYYLIWCQFRESKCNDTILERIIEQTETYKSKALITRAAFGVYKGQPETALRFYTESLKARHTVSDYIAASRGIALAKSMEGFHASSLRELERLLPLLKYAEPLMYFDVLNSYAVELIENGRIPEAHNAALVAASSPFGSFYPEWRETLSVVRSRRKNRSTVSFSVTQERECIPTELEPASNVIQVDAGVAHERLVPEDRMRTRRIKIVIDFMNTNLQRRLSLNELAKLANLSTSHLSRLFRTETKLSPWEYLIWLRMERARELVATSLLSIKEVMAAVGYDSKSHFSRHFRRAFGVSPSEYRRDFSA